MTPDRRLALWTGILYLATFATSFPALALKSPILAGEPQLAQAAAATALEIALAFTCVGTAVALYPIARRISEPLAIGFVASRTVEAGMILSGAIALLALIELGPAAAGAPVLVELHDAAFLLGPAFMSAINAALLGSVMLRGRLVPRVIPIIGLIGSPLLLASSFGVVLGAWEQLSPVGALTALPIAAWELSLGLWLTIRGVRMPAAAPGAPTAGGVDAAIAASARA